MVAMVLARGEEPNVFRLLQQYYELMAVDYETTMGGDAAFPLSEFAEYVYERRVEGNVMLGEEVFAEELRLMGHHKMVLPRRTAGIGGGGPVLWKFRHDKIMDFFIVHAFLGEDNPRPEKHLGDHRFVDVRAASKRVAAGCCGCVGCTVA